MWRRFSPQAASDHRDISCPVLTKTSPSSPDASLEKPAPEQCAVFQFTTSVLLASTLTVCVISVPEHGTTLTEYSRGLSKSANWGIRLHGEYTSHSSTRRELISAFCAEPAK